MAPPAHWRKMHMMQGVLLMVLVLWGAAGKGLSSRALKAVIQWGQDPQHISSSLHLVAEQDSTAEVWDAVTDKSCTLVT